MFFFSKGCPVNWGHPIKKTNQRLSTKDNQGFTSLCCLGLRAGFRHIRLRPTCPRTLVRDGGPNEGCWGVPIPSSDLPRGEGHPFAWPTERGALPTWLKREEHALNTKRTPLPLTRPQESTTTRTYKGCRLLTQNMLETEVQILCMS